VVDHPPGFWQRERVVSPESAEVWAWIWRHLGACLTNRPRLQRIDVGRNWKAVARELAASRPPWPAPGRDERQMAGGAA
jgi:hypothetical protein